MGRSVQGSATSNQPTFEVWRRKYRAECGLAKEIMGMVAQYYNMCSISFFFWFFFPVVFLGRAKRQKTRQTGEIMVQYKSVPARSASKARMDGYGR